MNEKDNDLLNNNNNNTKEESKVQKASDSNFDLKQEENNDEVINVELYNEILSSLFNSLSNPIVRNELKVNENILKYLELQISNLFFLETELAKELDNKKMAKEFLQLAADITNLPLSITKSHAKTRIQILEDRNLLIVTIINSCKGVERENLERVREVDSEALNNLRNQISALSDFTTGETPGDFDEPKNGEQPNNLGNLNNQNQMNNLNNAKNIKDLSNMANLSNLGILPQHPASNPNFYPYLSKPVIIPKLKKVLSGLLFFSSLLIIATLIVSMFVRGKIKPDVTKDAIDFVLVQSNSWLVVIMTVVLFFSFAYIFMKPTKILREKYRISYFMLGLLCLWLSVTIFYYFWEISDDFLKKLFLTSVKEENLNPEIVEQIKGLPNFGVFKVFAIITATSCIPPLLLVLVLILVNPRLDRNKIIRANTEYQNAISAALNGQKYSIDPSLFDSDEPSNNSKSNKKKISFSGRF